MNFIRRFISRRRLLIVAVGLLGASALDAAQSTLAAGDQPQANTGGKLAMKKFLIHIHTGPENPTKAALGFLVALTALKAGHKADVFLAGDGAFLIGDQALDSVEGKGTGRLGDHYKALADAGVRFYVSGMSAKA